MTTPPAQTASSLTAELRRQAEQRVDSPSRGSAAPLDEADMLRLLHELDIHAAELQIQNEELIRMRRESETLLRRYRQLFEHAPVGYVSTDAAGRILDANASAVSLFGRPHAHIIGTELSVLVDADSAQQVHSHLQRARLTKTKGICDVQVTQPGGAHLAVRLESVAVDGAEDTEGLCRTALIDETKRAMDAATIAQSETRLRTILDTAPDAIVTIDKEGIVRSFNPAATRIFGHTQSEIVGRSVALLMPSPGGDPRASLFSPQQTPGDRRTGQRRREVQCQHKDGTAFPADLMLSEPDDQGAVTAIIHDISEQKRLAAEYRQSQKMEAVGQLAAGIAHDFNNVLMGIAACSDMAQRKVGQDVLPYLREIKAAVASGTSVVRQLMTFSELKPNELSSIPIDDAIRRSEVLLRRGVPEHIAISFALGADGAAVQAAPGAVEQIVLNLTLNACDAMPRGGSLRIETSQEPERVVLSVSDTGVGMNEETRTRIFEPFFTTKGVQGTGLGLSMVFGLVKQMGGTIEVQSEVGKGTTFRIRLLRAEAAVDKVEKGAPALGVTGETILLVEDDPRVRMGVRHYLERAGYGVREAADGPEAMRIAREEESTIDLVLTDVMLPGGLSGAAVGKALQSKTGPAIILMSAHSRAMLENLTGLPSDFRLLQKPFSEATLLGAVREALTAKAETRKSNNR